MRSVMVAAALLSMALLFGITLRDDARADILEVRADGTGEFPDIRSAMFAAEPGDTVRLDDGTYSGPDNMNLNGLGKPLLICSRSNDPVRCVLDLEAPETPRGDLRDDVERRGFMFNQNEDSRTVVRGLTLRNGQTTGNYCLTMGPGICCVGGASPIIQSCIFHDNYSSSGGALATGTGSSPLVVDCLFRGNSVRDEGGAIYMGDGSAHYLRCRFVANQTPIRGGGIAVYGGTGKFEDCVFEENWADCGSVMVVNAGEPTFLRCLFRNNSSNEGGVVETWNGTTTFVECTLAFNVARYGGVLNSRGGEARFTSCTLYRNEGVSSIMRIGDPTSKLHMDHSIIASSPDGMSIFCTGGTVEVACCDFFGNHDGDWMTCIHDQYNGVTNVSVDPLFCDPENGNFHVQPLSWCAPWNNPGCGLVGAWTPGCTVDAPDGAQHAMDATVRVIPNPAGEMCRIEWPALGAVTSVEIIDAAGRLVRGLRDLPAGTSSVRWNAQDDCGRRLPSGIYMVRVAPSRGNLVTKLVLE